jgi:hypothetical protein
MMARKIRSWSLLKQESSLTRQFAGLARICLGLTA